MSAAAPVDGQPTAAGGSVRTPIVHVRRMRGWDAVLFGLAGLSWSWRCADPACITLVVGRDLAHGRTATWRRAMGLATEHVSRWHVR